MARIAFIGFGEAAQAFAAGWRQEMPDGPDLAAHDIKIADPATAGALRRACADLSVDCAATLAEALPGRSAVISLVTADAAGRAAEAAAAHIAPGTLYLDGNSCAPGTKRAAARAVEAAGGRYVDMAVMAPVHPRRHRTPVLLAGPAAAEAMALAGDLGMSAEVAGNEVGAASAIKMLRSVMIKGLEALTAECLLAARRAGVEEAVIASLQASDPGWDWRARGAYNIERMLVHGARRAAEMREVAATLRELGLPDRMAAATAEWQDEMASLDLPGGAPDLGDRADRVLGRMAP